MGTSPDEIKVPRCRKLINDNRAETNKEANEAAKRAGMSKKVSENSIRSALWEIISFRSRLLPIRLLSLDFILQFSPSARRFAFYFVFCLFAVHFLRAKNKFLRLLSLSLQPLSIIQLFGVQTHTKKVKKKLKQIKAKKQFVECSWVCFKVCDFARSRGDRTLRRKKRNKSFLTLKKLPKLTLKCFA